MVTATPRSIAILGGTGALGSGIAARLAHAGPSALIGSREAGRAVDVAAALTQEHGGQIAGFDYAGAAAAAEIVFLTVPFASQVATLEAVRAALSGKILIDTTVPLVPPKVGRVQLPDQGCAALIAQTTVGPDVQVVSAMQNVGARHLSHIGEEIDCDVLVTGDAAEARETVIALLGDIGLRAFHAGPLANAAAAEALTSILITLNRHYKSDRAGIRITGV